MKKTVILAMLVLTVRSYGQSNADKTQAVLTQMGVNDSSHSVTFYQETPFGTFFTIQTIKSFEAVLNEQAYIIDMIESFDTYLIVGDAISAVPSLKGYINFGYSVTKQAFIVGRYGEISFNPQVEEVYKYELKSKELVSQGIFTGGVYGARIFNSNMSLLLAVKNVDGLGNTLTYLPFPIN